MRNVYKSLMVIGTSFLLGAGTMWADGRYWTYDASAGATAPDNVQAGQPYFLLLLSGKSLDAENMVFRSPLNRLIHCTSSKVSPLYILCKHIFSGQPLYIMIRSSEINRLSHIQSLSGA